MNIESGSLNGEGTFGAEMNASFGGTSPITGITRSQLS